MQAVTLFNLTHVLSHSLNTLSETIFSNSLIFQEFAKLKYTLNLKISKSQNLTNAKISRPKVEVLWQSSNAVHIDSKLKLVDRLVFLLVLKSSCLLIAKYCKTKTRCLSKRINSNYLFYHLFDKKH